MDSMAENLAPCGCDQLAPPPRTVPLGLRWHLLSRGLLSGSVFIAFTWLFALPGLLNLNLLNEWWLAQGHQQIQGQVTGWGNHWDLISSFEYYQYHFQLPDGTTHHGISYGKNAELEKVRGGAAFFNAKVLIEYNPDHPRANRIQGMSAGNFGLQTLVPLLFPIFAFAFLMSRAKESLARIHLLRHGIPAWATITTCYHGRDADEKGRGFPVEEFKRQCQTDKARKGEGLKDIVHDVRCHFECHLPDGQVIQGCDTMSLDLRLNVQPPVAGLYDPARPQRLQFLQNLGPSLQVLPTGEWEAEVSGVKTWVALLVGGCCLMWPWCVWAWVEWA